MLRLLLDADITHRAVQEVRRHEPDCPIVSIPYWEDGGYLEKADEDILAEAYRQSLTLVTRDISTVSPLLAEWDAQGREHAGVIFVDNRTIVERDIGTLVRALIEFWAIHRHEEWTRRVMFLPRPTAGPEV